LVKGFLSRIATRLSGELPNSSLEGAGWAGEGTDGGTKLISSRAKTPIKQEFGSDHLCIKQVSHRFQAFSRSLSLTAFVPLMTVVQSLGSWSSTSVTDEVLRTPEGIREPSGGRRLASAVVVRHGRCKASFRPWDISAAESLSSSERADPEGPPNRKWRGSR